MDTVTIRWGRRTATGVWHYLTNGPAFVYRTTACGKRMRGTYESVRQDTPPQGRVCAECAAAARELI